MQSDEHMFIGMKRDSHPIRQEAQFMWNAFNVRITRRDHDTQLSITNERSPEYKTFFYGDYIGHCVLGKYLVLFTKEAEGKDIITRVEVDSNNIKTIYLSRGLDLGFDQDFPIQAIGISEQPFINKVYWVDGKNQPRMINITLPELKEVNVSYNGDYSYLYSTTNNTVFNFSPICLLNESISVRMDHSYAGLFPSGVIQYVFTYFFKYGQETNIIHTSELIPLANVNRGGRPDENIYGGIKITINDFDSDFDYIRIYSILRTSLDATPIAKKVVDIPLSQEKKTITYVDLGTEGEIIDPAQLLYTGSKDIIPNCIYSKENTLFLGNILYNRSNIRNIRIGGSSISEKIRNLEIESCYSSKGKINNFVKAGDNGYLSAIEYKNLVNENLVGFKTGNTYRLGVQFQYKTGEWSEPVYIGDKEEELRPHFNATSVYTSGFSVQLSDEIVNGLLNNEYHKARPVVVLPKINERKVVAQGLLCPTIFNVGTRSLNAPFAQSSWFIRPTMNERGVYGNKDELSYKWLSGSPTQWKHLHPLMCFYKIQALTNEGHEYSLLNGINPRTVEIQNTMIDRCAFENKYNRNSSNKGKYIQYNSATSKGNSSSLVKGWREIPYLQKIAYLNGRIEFKEGSSYRDYFDEPINDSDKSRWYKVDNNDYNGLKELNKKSFDNQYFVDRSIITMHSPDIEFNDAVRSYLETESESLKINIVGSTTFANTHGDISMIMNTATIGDAEGFVYNQTDGKGSLVAGLFYRDQNVDETANAEFIQAKNKIRGYMVHLWNCSNSVNNDVDRSNLVGTRSAMLTTKKISNVKSCSRTWWIDDPSDDEWRIDNGKLQLFHSDEVTMLKIPETDCSFQDSVYFGNVDTLTANLPYYTKLVDQCLNVEVSAFDYGEDNGEDGPDAEWADQERDEKGDYDFDSLVEYFEEPASAIGDWDVSLRKKSDTVRIRYKSTSHLVFSIKNKNVNSGTILPSICNSEYEDIFSVHCTNTYGRGGINGTVLPSLGLKKEHIRSYNQNKFTKSENYYPLRGLDDDINTAPTYFRVKDLYWNSVPDSKMYDEIDVVKFKPIHNLPKGTKEEELSAFGIRKHTIKIGEDTIEGYDNPYPSSWIGEIWQDVDKESIFGGKTQEALQNNLWIIAGDEIKLKVNAESPVESYSIAPIIETNPGAGGGITGSDDNFTEQVDPANPNLLVFKWGDTWYQQYELLKTYPFSPEDVNQVVEVGRFLCESYINVGGRYDRNQGNESQLNANPTNFNLMNPVYNQLNNFFKYRIFDDDYYKNQKFESQILFSDTKQNGSITDNWTHVHAAASLDLDNKLGAVTSINSNNETLIAFQEKGISQILFNSRVQVQASDGVPIEIANRKRVDGYRIISNNIGCIDKFAVAETSSGLYFIDSMTKSIYKLSEGIDNLSISLGSLYWLKDINYNTVWKPKKMSPNGIRLSFDSTNNDVYFIPGPSDYNINTLCYSPLLNQFVSFYPYDGSVMFDFNNRFYALKKALTPMMRYETTNLYEMFAGNTYCNDFKGDNKGFEFSFISNKQPDMTKIFDTLEFEGSVLDENSEESKDDRGYSLSPIDSIYVDNEYQKTHKHSLSSQEHKLDLKKKFRMWRMIIPRCAENRMERIRNQWSKITLSGLDNANKRCIIHNIMVKYSI